ncbi:MAG: hypothetical protein LBE59_02025, partial [Nevskiaceae bacterium]|nr:hypothetical protein [Nevskiaceae bacterium]
MSVRQLIKRGLARYDIAITRYNKLKRLERDSGAAEALRFMREMPRQQLPSLIEYIDQFKSQNRQDLFALCENGFKRNGYFVEFGATDGVNGSNSYLLEKSFGWQGIVAEPARCWHAQLRANRSCAIDTA